MQFKIDTVSQVNIIPFVKFHSMKYEAPMLPTDNKLSSYTGNDLPVVGKIKLKCSYTENSKDTLFYIVESNAQ